MDQQLPTSDPNSIFSERKYGVASGMRVACLDIESKRQGGSMSITRIAEPSMKIVTNDSYKKETAEPRKATPIGIAAAQDSLKNIEVKELDQLADDAKSTYEDSKELFKLALRTVTEMEERKSQVISKLD
jgi:hypothetical protein